MTTMGEGVQGEPQSRLRWGCYLLTCLRRWSATSVA
jgi:hypothetical protein